jgi:hypothetical protein
MTHARAASTIAALLSSLVLVACGGSSTKGGGGTSGGSGGKSGQGGKSGSAGGTSGGVPKTLACMSSAATMGTACTQAELDAYATCVATACDATFKTCFGPDFKSGQYSGPCGTHETCASTCACSDDACRTACGTAPTECTTCQFGLVSCALPCVPSCATAGLGGAFGGLGGSFGGLGGSFGGLGGSFGGLGGSFGGLGGSSGSGTCLADAVACCNRAAAANQTACNTAYQAIAALGETTCTAGLAALKSSYCP